MTPSDPPNRPKYPQGDCFRARARVNIHLIGEMIWPIPGSGGLGGLEVWREGPAGRGAWRGGGADPHPWGEVACRPHWVGGRGLHLSH